MQNIFARAEAFVQLDRGIVPVVCLHVYHPSSFFSSDLSMLVDQTRRNPATPIFLLHREIVNIDLAAFLLELLQHVSSQPGHNVPIHEGDERDDD